VRLHAGLWPKRVEGYLSFDGEAVVKHAENEAHCFIRGGPYNSRLRVIETRRLGRGDAQAAHGWSCRGVCGGKLPGAAAASSLMGHHAKGEQAALDSAQFFLDAQESPSAIGASQRQLRRRPQLAPLFRQEGGLSIRGT